jgi:hypothetical protein
MSAAGKESPVQATLHACTRRSFLLTALAGALGVGVIAACKAPTDTGSAFEQWSAWLLGNNANHDAVVRLGKAYLRAYPADGDEHALLAQIDTVITANLELGTPDSADLLQVGAALEQAVRADYAGDKVVAVEGWVLSATEARLYAAVALA